MVFRERLDAERTGPADTKGVDVTFCRRDTGLRERSVSGASVLRFNHLLSLFFPQVFIHLSPSSKFSSQCLLLISGLQGDILTVIRRVDEHWIEAKLGDKVGICPQQFTEASPSFLPSILHRMNVGCGLFKMIKVDTCCLALWSVSVALVIN